MKSKLILLVVVTAAVSFACANNVERVHGGEPKEPLGRTQTTSYQPMMLQQTELVLRGRCVAKLTYDQKSGGLIDVQTDSPCRVTEDHLLVNGQEVLDLSGSITFGSGTKYCRRLADGRLKCICLDPAC